MSIEETLINKYGAVMNISQLAVLLGRSPEALRQALRKSCEWAHQINAAKFYLGKRLYFRTPDIAKVLSGSGAE